MGKIVVVRFFFCWVYYEGKLGIFKIEKESYFIFQEIPDFSYHEY